MRSTRVRRRGVKLPGPGPGRASIRVCEASPGRPPPREPRIPARRGPGSRCPSLPGVRRGPSFECLPFRGGGCLVHLPGDRRREARSRVVFISLGSNQCEEFFSGLLSAFLLHGLSF